MDRTLLFSAVNVMYDAEIDILALNGWFVILATILQTIPPIILVPRFVLNLREIHARGLQGRQGSNIDTGFGLGSEFEQGAIRSAIEFVEPTQNESEERGDEMEMKIQEVDGMSGLA